MVKIKTVAVGSDKLNQEQMRQAIEQETRNWVSKGWTLRAHGSRGGCMYLTFARKEKGG